jgi:Fur family zinc uptake transcriptional regulator
MTTNKVIDDFNTNISSVSLDQILERAAEKCSKSGTKLTEKRSKLLTILIQSEKPLSAYEVVDLYNATAEKSMPAMSAYRILDYLVSEELAHKLSSENKYIACSHIICCNEHKVSQFLICRKCHQVKEIAISKEIIESLKQHVAEADYQLTNSQLELDCLCSECCQSEH